LGFPEHPQDAASEAQSMDEPRKHPIYLTVLALAALGTVPFLFVGRATRLWLGVPLWLWSSAGFTLLLSACIAWGVVRYWDDDDAR